MDRKRKVTFAPEPESDQQNKKQKNQTKVKGGNTRLHSGQHTLESDEEYEEEEDNANPMSQDDLDEIAPEASTIDFDDDIKVTPFNIDEELEEGHYDEAGCFQWKKKDKDEVHDAWLDEIDWTDVKNYKLKDPKESTDDLNNPPKTTTSTIEDDADTNDASFNEAHTIKSLLVIMQPGETVTRTIKRLGVTATNNKSKQHVKQRKPLPGEIPMAAPAALSPEELKKNKLLLEEMTGLADQFVINGQVDIYQETFEQLKSKLDRLQSTASSSSNTPQFDMYGEGDVATSVTKSTLSTTKNDSATVLWEYKTDETSSLQGPFTTEHMIRLLDTDGKIDKNKTLCRRVGTEIFYSIKRIDFDLYVD